MGAILRAYHSSVGRSGYSKQRQHSLSGSESSPSGRMEWRLELYEVRAVLNFIPKMGQVEPSRWRASREGMSLASGDAYERSCIPMVD